MRILVLSNTPWRTDNSFGNSFSNIFGGMEGIEIANIYCRYGAPDSRIVTKSFQITEKSLIRNLMNKSRPSGIETTCSAAVDLDNKEQKVFDSARKGRLQIYYWCRDFIWKIGRWKSEELKQFIKDFDPDLIFQPVYYSVYINDIAFFIKKFTNVPMVGYISDDCYTLKQFNLSLLYWIDRLIKRRKVKRTIDKCDILYVISQIQKQEYDKCFSKDCKILCKGAQFDKKPEYPVSDSDVIKLVYTGNIGTGRYKQLSNIGHAIKQINAGGKKAELDIYTLTPMTGKMKKALDLPDCIHLKGAISSDSVAKVQSEADILVHVESFGLKSRLATRQSFSTKIVDYLAVAKCIFAVGPADVASIDYLKSNDAAVVATNKDEITTNLKQLFDNKALIEEYGHKAWECGKRNHQIDLIQKRLAKDFDDLIKKTNQ